MTTAIAIFPPVLRPPLPVLVGCGAATVAVTVILDAAGVMVVTYTVDAIATPPPLRDCVEKLVTALDVAGGGGAVKTEVMTLAVLRSADGSISRDMSPAKYRALAREDGTLAFQLYHDMVKVELLCLSKLQMTIC
jgi:hypothetical protein